MSQTNFLLQKIPSTFIFDDNLKQIEYEKNIDQDKFLLSKNKRDQNRFKFYRYKKFKEFACDFKNSEQYYKANSQLFTKDSSQIFYRPKIPKTINIIKNTQNLNKQSIKISKLNQLLSNNDAIDQTLEQKTNKELMTQTRQDFFADHDQNKLQNQQQQLSNFNLKTRLYQSQRNLNEEILKSKKLINEKIKGKNKNTFNAQHLYNQINKQWNEIDHELIHEKKLIREIPQILQKHQIKCIQLKRFIKEGAQIDMKNYNMKGIKSSSIKSMITLDQQQIKDIIKSSMLQVEQQLDDQVLKKSVKVEKKDIKFIPRSQSVDGKKQHGSYQRIDFSTDYGYKGQESLSQKLRLKANQKQNFEKEELQQQMIKMQQQYLKESQDYIASKNDKITFKNLQTTQLIKQKQLFGDKYNEIRMNAISHVRKGRAQRALKFMANNFQQLKNDLNYKQEQISAQLIKSQKENEICKQFQNPKTQKKMQEKYQLGGIKMDFIQIKKKI